MSGLIFLSHELNGETPGFGGKSEFSQKPRSEISKGASSNSQLWELSNHVGTHIDLPFHFHEHGKTLSEYDASTWVFEKPHMVELAVSPSTIIGFDKWCETIPKDCDFLIVKTGFEKFRQESTFWESNPGFGPDLGRWIRVNRPSIRAIGFDVISLTAFQSRPVGREAHQAFLSPEGEGRPVLIVEDMRLSELKSSPKRITVLPLRVSKADGAPVTVLAETAI